MKTISWTGAKGNRIELRAYCETTMVDDIIDADGYQINAGKKPFTEANLELWVDGKKVDSCWNTDFWRIIDARQGYKKIWGLPVGMTAEQAAIVERWLKEVIEEGKSEEVKAYEAAKAEAEKASEIANAKKIVEKASKQSRMMTNKEYKEWARHYNNLMNEGGEGYIPEFVTVEQLEWAKKILAEA